MKYIVSNSERLFGWEIAKRISVGEALEMLFKEPILGFDTETTGLSCFNSKLLSSQFGTTEFQVLFDHATIDIQLLKPLLESDILFVGQNLKFDLRFLYHHGIIPKMVYDLWIVEILLTNGLKYNGRTLKDLAWDYLEVVLDKTQRGVIIYKGLNEETVNYALRDVEFLLQIRDLQLKKVKDLNLEVAVALENAFVRVLTYIEHCGIKLDTVQWMAKFDKNKKQLLLSEAELNSYLWNNNHQNYFDAQLDLFSDVRKCLMNWSSNKQVFVFFNKLGINTKEYKNGVEKSSVDAKIIEKQKNDFPIIPLYIKYKELQKECGTYGENWLNYVEPSTGRIHTSFQQLMDTSRISSGDRDGKHPKHYWAI